MFRDAVHAFQRWQYRGGRLRVSARASNRLAAIAFAAGFGPKHTATLEVRGHKSGRIITLPVVVADYGNERYLVAMLGRRTNWVRNLQSDNHALLRQRRRRQPVLLIEDESDARPEILRRYLELAPGARPFFPVDHDAPLTAFEPIVDRYPVFRVVPDA